MKKARICKCFGASFLAFCILLCGIALPGGAQAASIGPVRVLLTRFNLTDQMTLSLDGSYTVGDGQPDAVL